MVRFKFWVADQTIFKIRQNFHFEPIEQFWVADQTIFKIRQNFHFEPIEHLKCVSVEPVQMSFVVGIFQNSTKLSF